MWQQLETGILKIKKKCMNHFTKNAIFVLLFYHEYEHSGVTLGSVNTEHGDLSVN